MVFPPLQTVISETIELKFKLWLCFVQPRSTVFLPTYRPTPTLWYAHETDLKLTIGSTVFELTTHLTPSATIRGNNNPIYNVTPYSRVQADANTA